MAKVSPFPFFTNWSGHPISDLADVLSIIKHVRPSRPIVWLAGDSSLDNKAWVPSAGPGGDPLPVPTPSIYSSFLKPPVPKPDIAFWLNHFLGSRATCLNAAVEATLLRDRDDGLLLHDQFIRDNICSEDILIVSVGANDIALAPNASTARYMSQLAWLTSRSSIENGTASALKYFKHMFGQQTQTYISRLVEKQKPRAVLVCMIYYPCEGRQNGWAETQLMLLRYNQSPGQLQAAISKVFEQATAEIKLDGTQVVPVKLFEVLDGKDKDDYVERVEPSVQGGKKMAQLFFEHLDKLLPLEANESA